MSDKHGRPTIGVLAGWQVYAGATPISYLESVLRGVQSAARDLGCNLLVACGLGRAVGPVTPAWPVPSPGADFVPVGPWNTDGLLVLRPLLSDKRVRDVQRFVAGGHPVVYVGAGEGGPAVDSDEETSVQQAVTHLVEHGHRRIGFVAGRKGGEGSSDRRLAAYRAALRAHGLEDDGLVIHSLHPLDDGREAVEHLLNAGETFTALLALNDRMAIGAMRALERAGRRIPEDVAVIGFDDRPEALAQTPPLASVRLPMAEMGYRGLGLLLDVMEGRAGSSDVIRVPTRLIVRQSCGCPPRAAPVTRGEQEAGPTGAEAMVEAVAGELRHVKPDEVRSLGNRLREAFAASLEQGDAAAFGLALDDVLRRVEAAGDDAHPWQAAITILHQETPSILEACPAGARELADDLLHRARIAIGESTRRQHARHLVQEADVADQLSWMTSHLLETLDEEQVFAVLADYLPQVGVDRAHVALFESGKDNPAAWSSLRSVPGQTAVRFPTREFPPRGLIPEDERFSLALLPLAVQEERGFVAFATGDLGPCAVVLRQLAAALRSVRLYRQAVEGRRLAEAGEQLAREANLLKGRLLSTVSHELRTPLSVIVGLSETLLNRQRDGVDLPEPYRGDVERIHAGAQHLDGLIRDVLDLARSEAGQLRLACEPLNLAEVLQPVVVVGERMARDKKLAWRAAIPDDLPRVWGDRTRLRQVALNLVSNAVKFTSKGGVTLRVGVKRGSGLGTRDSGSDARTSPEPRSTQHAARPPSKPCIADKALRSTQHELRTPDHEPRTTQHVPQVASPESQTEPYASRIRHHAPQIPSPASQPKPSDSQAPHLDPGTTQHATRSTNPQSPVITIAVTDTGLGIPPTELETIFDEFRQGERTTARGYGGLGLGLAICKRLVEMHDGRIWAESPGEEGGGSTFHFTLPVLEEEEGDKRGRGEGGEGERERGEEGRGGERERVVLFSRRAGEGTPLGEHLERRGFEVAEYGPGEIGERLAGLPAPPRAVVLDLGLASERGWEVLRTLRENPATRDVPVLFCSLEGEEGGSVLELDYMTKPLGPSELARALARQGLGADDGEREERTILVVDDDPGVLEMHARIVQSQLPACRVLRARDGREGLEKVREELPDLVLLDLMMPELDGFGVLEAMREDEVTRDVPVIVLTGQALTDEDMQRLNRGVAAVLGKGLFSAGETLAHVEAALVREPRLGGEMQRVVRRAMAFIHAHYADPISREEVARHAGVSKRHLSRCFRQETGLSLATYLTRARIERAKELLAAGESVTDVATATGFANRSHFSRVFRREVGVAPSKYTSSGV